MAAERSKSAVGRIERAMNLLALLLDRREPVPWESVRENVEGYSSDESRPHRNGVVREAGSSYGLKKAEIAAEKRFARDRKLLADAGINVHYQRPAGYYIERGDCFLPGLRLSVQERALLWRIQRLAAEGGAAQLSPHLLSAVQKLLFEEPDDIPFEENFRSVCRIETPDGEAVRDNFAVLNRAVSLRRVVTFHYYSISRDSVADRVVAPYALGAYAGRWYLVGRCLVRQAVRLFRLDRIVTRVKLRESDSTDPDYVVPDDFDINDYLGRRAWAMKTGLAEEPGVQARVRFDAATGRYAAELLADASCAMEPNGECVAALRITREEPFFRWLMKFGRHAELLSPQALRRRFVESVRETRKNYSEDKTNVAGIA